MVPAIQAIRATNPRRLLIVDSVFWADPTRLSTLALPNDANIMASIHFYEPKLFTFQGMSWMGPEYLTTGVVFPGPPATPVNPVQAAKDAAWANQWFVDYNTKPAATNPSGPATIAAQLALISAYRQAQGRAVYNGEWGPQSGGALDSRVRLVTMVRQECEKGGIGWAIWEDPVNMNVFDSLAGPEGGNGAAVALRGGKGHVDGLAPGLPAQYSVDGDISLGGGGIAALQNDRAGAKEIGNRLRIDAFYRQVAEIHLRAEQHGRGDPLVEPGGGRLSGRVQGDVLGGALALAGHAVDQEKVHGVADAEGEHARPAPVLADVVDDLHVIADIAIGHVADDSEAGGIVRHLQHVVNGLKDVGAAVTLDRLQEPQRLLHVAGGVGNRLIETGVDLRVEGHELEGVVRV